jgi:hypothetical protein
MPNNQEPSMTEEPPANLYEGSRRVRTVILNTSTREQLALLDAATWPPVGSVIELEPSGECVVTAVRLVLETADSGGASIIVAVKPGEAG